MAIKLGTVVTDSITGFKGMAVSRTEYINGCARICVQPQALHDGKPIESCYFDELQLLENKPELKKKKTGGPGDCAPFPSAPQ